MLQNAYLLAKIGADTAENERNCVEILPKIGNYPTGPLPYEDAAYRAHEAHAATLGARAPGATDEEQEEDGAVPLRSTEAAPSASGSRTRPSMSGRSSTPSWSRSRGGGSKSLSPWG